MNTNQGNPPQNGGEPPANNQNDRGKRKKHISKKKRQQRKVRDQLAKERCKIRRLFKTGENYSFEKELTVEELIEQNWTRLSADDFEKIRNTWEKMYANDVTVGSFHDIFESKLPPFLRPVDAVDDAEAAETAQEVEWTAERNPNDAAATRVKPMAPNSENRINDVDGKDAAGAARASKDKGNGDDELKDKKRKLSTNDNGQKKAKSTTHGADDSCEVAKGWVGPSDRDAMQDKEIKDHQEKLKTPFHDEGYTTSRGTDGKVDAIVKGNAPVPATNATAVLPRLKTHADGTTKLLVVNEEMEDEGKLIKAARKKIIEEKAPIRATDATKVLAATSVPKTDLKDDTSSLNKSYIRAASKQVVSVSKIAKRMALARAKNVRKDLDSSSGKRESGILNATSPTVWSSKISTMTTKRPSGNRPPSGRPSKKQKQPTRRLTRADCGTTYHSGSPESIEEGSRCYYFGTDRVLHPIFVGKINEEKKIQVTMILTERLRSKLFSDSECTIEVPADGIFAYLRAPEVKVGDKKYIAVEKAARTFANSHGTDSYGEKTVCASDEIDAVRKVIKPGLYQVGNSCIFYCCNGNQSLRDMSQKKFLRVPHAKIARDNAHLVEDVGADEQVATFIPKEGEIILLPIYFQGRPVVGNKEIQPSDAGQLPRLPMKSPKTIQPKDATSAQLSQLPMKSLNGRLGKRKQQLLETKINNTVRQFLRHEGSGRCNKGDFKRRIRTVLPNLNRDQVEKIRMQWDVRAGEMGEQRFDDLFADFDPEAAIDVVGAENSSGGEGPTQLAANQEDVGSSSNNSSSGSGEETAIQLQAGNQVQRVLAMQNAGIVVAAAGLLMESRTGENTHDGIDHAFRSQMSTTMDIPAELLRKGVAAQKIPSGDVTLSEEITGNNKTGEEGYSCSNNKKLKAAGNVLEEEQATVNYDSKKTRQVQQPSPSSQDDKDLDHGMVVDGDDKTSKAEKNIDSSTKNDAEIEEQVFEAIELNHDRETCAATLAAATTSNIRVKSSSSNSNDHKHCCGSAKNNTGTKDRNVCVPSNQDNDKMIENNRNKDLPAVASMRQQAGPRTEVSPSSSETPTTTGRVTSTSKLRAHWKDDTSSPDETHYLPAVASTQQDIQSLDPRPAPRPVDPVRPDPESPPQRVACQTQCSASIRQEASNYLTQFTQLVARFPPQSQYKTAVLLSRDLINHQPYCVGTPCLREALQEFLKMVVDHYNLRSVFLELALDMWRNPQPEGLYPPHISWCLE